MKKNIRSVLFLLFVCLLHLSARSQSGSCHLKISLLTCGPGEDLYSIFGHSALRVVDSSAQTDIIYNYGTFDFEDPDFYIKFTRGKLLYFVSPQSFDTFMYEYQVEKRWVIEQELALTCNEKHKLYEALRFNALEQNKYYLYEFLYDNCSTRLRDMVKANNSDTVQFKRILPENPPSFRNMLHSYLDRGKQYWSEFGIDLLLGSRIDKKVKNEEAMFLPDYLMKGFDSAVVRNKPLVSNKKPILPATEGENTDGFAFTPMMATTILLAIGILLSFVRRDTFRKFINIFDGLIFFILGFMGCFILFMWLGTEHELCRDNYNLLWALPTHILIAFLLNSKKVFVRRYFAVTAIICALILVTCPFFPQGMNIAFFPLIMLSGIRSAIRTFKK